MGTASWYEEDTAWSRAEQLLMAPKRRIETYSDITAEEALHGLPRKHLPTVYHVGEMNPSKRRPYSLEGPALSVSTDPDIWRPMARLSGPTIRMKGGLFLHATALSGKQWDKVRAWGQQQGHTQAKQGFHAVTDYDDELGSGYFSFHDTEKDAMEEGADWTRPAVQRTAMHTEARGMSGDDYSLLKLAQSTGKRGVWWSDDYGPLSAPRGALIL